MKVIIIGCGISGPVLAMLLLRIGHKPVVYERHPEHSEGGISLQLSPQTMKVLRILDLDKRAQALGKPIMGWKYTSELSGKVLFENPTLGKQLEESFGYPVFVVDRPKYQRLLVEEAQARGAEVHWEKHFIGLEKNEEAGKVIARFHDRTSDEGDLLVGCDGLRSEVRDAIFGKVEAAYTGIVMVAGTSNTPPGMDPSQGRQIFGNGAHMFFLPLGEDVMSWGCTLPQTEETKEDWRKASKEELEEILSTLPQRKFGGEAAGVWKGVRSAAKFAMYQRPILDIWHKGRVTLVGDAAHPAVPYLGQGANQSLEDCYHLVRLLKKHHTLSTEELDQALKEYEQLRAPRVIKTMEQAVREGGIRVTAGHDACLQRDEMLAKGMESQSWKVVLEMLQGPYETESEI